MTRRAAPILARTRGSYVALSPLVAGDAAAIFRALDGHRLALARWLPWLAAAGSIEALRALVEGACGASEQGSALAWVVTRSGDAVGMVTLEGLDAEDGTASVGVWLVPTAQRQGIASWALDAVVAHAFGALGCRRVEYRCAAENEPSRALARRLGLARDASRDDGDTVGYFAAGHSGRAVPDPAS